MLRSTLLVVVVLAGVAVAAPGFTGTDALPPGDAPPATPAQVSLPVQCLSERNVGACVTCCKEASGLPGNLCSRFCRVPVPPPPDGEPVP
ncbi:MAG TPA: hypothetical protein VMQ62_04150 [Dongiaceae bacterium]|nr:hypothetical protein [Dongiaceae bacterium]